MHIRNSLMSLYFPRKAAPARRGRARSTPATSITRLQAGMPQARPVPAQANATRRRRSPHPGYSRGSYLARPAHAASLGPRMFRIR